MIDSDRRVVGLHAAFDEVRCDWCRRTLLKGERIQPVMTASGRRSGVCHVCLPSAEFAGWRPDEEAEVRESPDRTTAGRGLFERWLTRRERSIEELETAGVAHAEAVAAMEQGGGRREGGAIGGRLLSAGRSGGAAEPRYGRADLPQVRRGTAAARSALSSVGEGIGPTISDLRSRIGLPTGGRESSSWLPDEPDYQESVDALADYLRGSARVAGGRKVRGGGTFTDVLQSALGRFNVGERFGEAPAERSRRAGNDMEGSAIDVPAIQAGPVQRGLDAFNLTEHADTVCSISRTLGDAKVTVREQESGSQVVVTVAWDLTWSKFLVDLTGGQRKVSLLEKGNELCELPSADRRWNAEADEHGRLSLTATR